MNQCSNPALDPRILALPVGHLQLTDRARVALRERETIGSLIAAPESRRRWWSSLVRSEISSVLDQLAKAMQRGTANGWEWFRRHRPAAADATAIYLTSFSFDRMSYAVRCLPVGTLHPSTRAATALARAEITTLEDLIGAAIRGLVNPRPGGAKTCLEIIEMLDALSEAIEANGECAWDRYANSQRIMLLPRKGNGRFVAEEYLKEFPAVIQAAVHAGFGRRGAALVRQLLLRVGRPTTLDKLAIRFAVSRQAIGRLKDRIVRELRAAFLKADYAGCRFRFRPEFARPLKDLALELSRAKGRAIGYPEWNRILASCWKTPSNCLGPIESGLLELLGFQLVTFKQARYRPIILPLHWKATPFRRAVARAELLLARDFAAGLSGAELLDGLSGGSDGVQLGRADVRAVTGSLRSVRWKKGARRYECRLRDLQSLGDRLERALRIRGKPAHFRELAPLVKKVSPTARKANERSVVVALSADKRFKAAGRTGLWALTEWRNVETRTVAELARVFLTKHNRPATETELFEFISPLRKVSKESIRTELKRNHPFLRVAPRTWVLVSAGGHQ